MSEFGLELLEQLSVPVDYEDFNVKDSKVTVSLSARLGAWEPSKLHDRKWNIEHKEMTQVGIYCL